MEKLVLNSETEKKLRSIIEYIDRQIHFDVFLDIHAINKWDKDKLSSFSWTLMNRYKNALCVHQENIDFLDKFLDFATCTQINRGFEDDIIQTDNWKKILEFYRNM